MEKILLLILIISAAGFSQVRKLTLRQSLELGMKNSKELKIAKAKVISGDAKITEVGSQMLPQLKFSAGYTRLSEVPPFEVTLPFSPNPIKISDVVLNNYQLKLSLQQPLFTGFKLSSLKAAARFGYKAAETDYDKTLNEAAFQIQESFWNYYKAEKVKKLVEENLKQIKQHLEDTKNFLKNELVTRNDLLKLEVQYSNVQLQLIEAENNVDLARIAFNKILGIDLDSDTEIVSDEIKPEKNKYSQSEMIKEAETNRKEIKSLQYQVKATDMNVTAANSGWFPSVVLMGNVYYNRPNQRIVPTQDKFKETWDVGIGLNWDLWNWGYTGSQATQAEQAKVQAETSLAQVKEAVEMDVYRSFLSYKKSYEKIDVSRKSVQQADENYRVTKERYNTQMATSTDLIDAEVALMQAKTNLTNSLVDYQMSKVQLEKSLGRKIY